MATVDRTRVGVEVVLLLALTLGQSAVYSVLRIVERLTRDVPLSAQTSTLNASTTPDRPWLDLGYQLNPIEGLLVKGKPEARPWRAHISIGQAF